MPQSGKVLSILCVKGQYLADLYVGELNGSIGRALDWGLKGLSLTARGVTVLCP